MSKLDLTKPVQTRDGRPVRIICTDKKGDFPLVALIPQTNNRNEEVCTYSLDGYYYKNEAQCDSDLVNVPEQKHKWINVYPDNYREYYVYDNLKEANIMAVRDDRIGIVHIVIENNKIVKLEQV